MAAKKTTSLERMLERVETLDATTLAGLAQRLAKERGLFERVFNVLQEGLLVVDADGEIAYAHASAHRLLGLKPDDVSTPSFWRVVPGLRAALAPAMESANPVTRELALSYPEPRTVRLHLVPLEAPADGPRRFAIILNDITREKLDTDQRIESERVASIMLLAAGVAHELGNPLNSLTIHLQVVERRLKKIKGIDKRDTEALTDSIRVCREEVARLDGIISNFLGAIRPNPPDLADTGLGDVLKEVLSFQQRELADRGITVEVEGTHALPLVLADRNQVKQVFFNLIKNASEAMPPGGQLRIRAGSDDEHVTLAFADNGSGIKPEDMARLFEPYHTTKPAGHGLGMMVVQRIMRSHGGLIGVESKAGQGTVVTLQFPQRHRRVKMLQ